MCGYEGYAGESYQGRGAWVQSTSFSGGKAVVDFKDQGINPKDGPWWLDAIHCSSNPSTSGLTVTETEGGKAVTGRLSQTTSGGMFRLSDDWDGRLDLELTDGDESNVFLLFIRRAEARPDPRGIRGRPGRQPKEDPCH